MKMTFCNLKKLFIFCACLGSVYAVDQAFAGTNFTPNPTVIETVPLRDGDTLYFNSVNISAFNSGNLVPCARVGVASPKISVISNVRKVSALGDKTVSLLGTTVDLTPVGTAQVMDGSQLKKIGEYFNGSSVSGRRDLTGLVAIGIDEVTHSAISSDMPNRVLQELKTNRIIAPEPQPLGYLVDGVVKGFNSTITIDDDSIRTSPPPFFDIAVSSGNAADLLQLTVKNLTIESANQDVLSSNGQ